MKTLVSKNLKPLSDLYVSFSKLNILSTREVDHLY